VTGLITGEYRALTKRGITEETTRKFGYQVGTFKDQMVQIAPYFDSKGTMVAQKIRFPNKDFTVLGDLKTAGLFGQQLWGPGRKLVITEGEIDALSVSQVQGNKWPVVSLPNGASGARKALSKSLEWLMQFEEVILMFDQDEPGQKAAQDCIELFPAGKCKVASLPLKDANECLQEGKAQEIITAIWNARVVRPDGVLLLDDDLLARAMKRPEAGLPWFLERLTEATYGRRYGEVYTFGAGTGVGKTDFLTQQVAFDVHTLKQSVGLIFLEQDVAETVQRVAGKTVGKLFHIPDAGFSEEELRDAIKGIQASATVALYDNWGSTEWEPIKSRIRYLAHAEGIRLFYVDHLTAMAAEADDEKKSLEKIMAQIAGLAKELDVIIHLVSHLATPDGKPHEEGGRVMIRHFKGSRSIGFWSHFMFGLERSQQDEDEKNRSLFRVLKDRYTGRATGLTIPLAYSAQTGLITDATGTEGFTEDAQEF
jgi:twinkle protein